MPLGAGHKAFPNLPNRIMACKTCIATYMLEFEDFAYLDVKPRDAGFCDICGGFRPLMSARNKKRNLAFADKREEREAHDIKRKTRNRIGRKI